MNLSYFFKNGTLSYHFLPYLYIWVDLPLWISHKRLTGTYSISKIISKSLPIYIQRVSCTIIIIFELLKNKYLNIWSWKYLVFFQYRKKKYKLATVTIIINAAIIILLVPCWSLGKSQDNIEKTLTNESPEVSVESNALICNSPHTFVLIFY